MTVVVEMSPTQTAQPATNPRKRKKRTPAPGASVDCFTCAERHLTCDRKRPFCSQCLDAGKDCSGYKTQLTWGVGVASRGKLRGLSLPVAGTERVSNDFAVKSKRRKESVASQLSSTQDNAFLMPDRQPPGTSPNPVPPNTPGTSWDTTPTRFQASIPSNGDVNGFSKPPYSGQPLGSPTAPTEHCQTFPFQTNIWNNHSQSTIRTSYPVPSPALTTPTCGPENGGGRIYFDQISSYHQSPLLISPTQSAFSQDHRPSIHEDGQIHRDGLSMLLHAGQSIGILKTETFDDVDEEYGPSQRDECAVTDELSPYSTTSTFDFNYHLPALSNVCNVGKTARMQYLINYYTEVISPVIVAFDGPTNPFRTHILRLATNSETLQHAISALAASNLRQRRGIGFLSTGRTAPARRSSFAHVHLSKEYTQGMLSPEEQMREETLHKRLAVFQLNQQLANPLLRKDDSILATLLILCLFHICDSGVAKFQTQFAGVRKLLSIRGDDAKIGTEDSRWMSRLFTWFDSLAATVNDREGQITGHFLDMPALCGDWSLENMAGIDSKLFKTISKLSQLNMLQQGKSAVTASQVSRPLTQLPTAVTSSPFVDGNGWLANNGTSMHDYLNSSQFWKEWEDIRHELLAWQLDTTLFDTVSKESSCLTMEQRVDLENISQSFRYSALLYLERLARPESPPGDESFQIWVRQSLMHIKRVQSDVYLLWPLFITGSECIDDESRDLIRGRCTDIQKDSGFVNNASCLQLLEKVWKFNSPGSSPSEDGIGENSRGSTSHQSGSAFAFRNVMIREATRTEGEGEYIVV